MHARCREAGARERGGYRLCACNPVFCTATQPALVKRPEEKLTIGRDDNEMHSLLGEAMERELQARMRRVQVEPLGKQRLAEPVAHFGSSGQSSSLVRGFFSFLCSHF